MKTIQDFTRYQFAENTILIGDKAIWIAAYLLAFAFLVLPFVLLIAKLN